MAWFRRDKSESMDPQYLLAQANAATPLEQTATTSAATSGFQMTIEDVFTIQGRGTVVTGRVESGSITNGAKVRLTRTSGATRKLDIAGIEMFRKQVDTATTGDNIGLLLRGVSRDDVGAGDVLSA
jgi:translation elongation factor EF-Tu-like GTPase